ncbi:hypothetical protein EYC80_004675 [Monilinia laxa]|uniref:Uncharacterized protein n=1 Tax=Monilinia laxa TaxID=61186 RepID=A0A5N6KHU4_MONLA|nr:hypothetical protein EYC80_004675 [Monilinia laxa]
MPTNQTQPNPARQTKPSPYQNPPKTTTTNLYPIPNQPPTDKIYNDPPRHQEPKASELPHLTKPHPSHPNPQSSTSPSTPSPPTRESASSFAFRRRSSFFHLRRCRWARRDVKNLKLHGWRSSMHERNSGGASGTCSDLMGKPFSRNLLIDTGRVDVVTSDRCGWKNTIEDAFTFSICFGEQAFDTSSAAISSHVIHIPSG